MNIRVLIADDHAVVREGLKRIIDDTPEMEVVGEACRGEEVLQQVRSEPVDVLVLDITMPGITGIEILKLLRSERPNLPILVLSMHPEDQYAIRVLKAGAAGYLTKESAPGQLVEAIKKVFAGGKYITPSVAEKIVVNMEGGLHKQPHEILSDREYQVLCLIASGRTVKEIAEEISLSVKTISTYRRRILQKMGMKNNAELIHYAVERGL
ncbi:MAG: response regulator [bacterium]